MVHPNFLKQAKQYLSTAYFSSKPTNNQPALGSHPSQNANLYETFI
jgi:hypothetical protein